MVFSDPASPALLLNNESRSAVRHARARNHALDRGRLVCDILEKHIDLSGCVVLDAGCGYGGCSIALAERGADVIAVDKDTKRLQSLATLGLPIELEHADIAQLPYPDNSFDVVVLQDVLEHLADASYVLTELSRVMQPSGILYLSTPNRLAISNMIADPHFGLPFASLRRRESLRRLLTKRRPAEAHRDDLAQLLSFNELLNVLESAGLQAEFVNSVVAEFLFERPLAVVWSDMHLGIVRWMQRSHLQHFALRFVRDRAGFFNTWVNPTWYALCRKTPS